MNSFSATSYLHCIGPNNQADGNLINSFPGTVIPTTEFRWFIYQKNRHFFRSLLSSTLLAKLIVQLLDQRSRICGRVFDSGQGRFLCPVGEDNARIEPVGQSQLVVTKCTYIIAVLAKNKLEIHVCTKASKNTCFSLVNIENNSLLRFY